MRITTGFRALPLLFALAFAACGDDDPIGGNLACGLLGTFDGGVAGDLTVNLDGCAGFGVVPASGGDPAEFGLVFAAGTEDDPVHLVVIGREGTRPGNGVYNVGVNAGQIFGLITIEGATDRFFLIDGGTLTITSSSANGVNGSVNMTATETSGAGAEITLTGTFQARCVDTVDNDC